jgi:hypothetical protein
MTKYLTEKEIDEIIGEIIFDKDFSTMSQDSYNEELIAKKIKTLNNKELCYAAINMATVGFGNQKYGQFRIGENILNIQVIFQKNNIKFNNPRSSLLKEDDITANRLCRFYRHKIRKFISHNNIDSYIWRKYTDRNPKFKHICFRGAEYLDDLSAEEAQYLLDAIKNMDLKLGINVAERVIRVFDAKGTKYK